MTARFDIVPASVEHEAWIRDGFAWSVREAWPYSAVDRSLLVANLLLRRRQPDATTLVAHVRGEPDLFLGWLAAAPSQNEIIFAVTKYPYRQRPELRVATTLAEAAGIDFSRTVGVRYWTRAAQRIAAHPGYKLTYAVIEPEDE